MKIPLDGHMKELLWKEYTDYIPQISEQVHWEFDEYNKIILRKTNGKEFQLDRYGSFVWQRINGTDSIETIIQRIMETFGEEKAFATTRGILFFQMLRTYGLINFQKLV